MIGQGDHNKVLPGHLGSVLRAIQFKANNLLEARLVAEGDLVKIGMEAVPKDERVALCF